MSIISVLRKECVQISNDPETKEGVLREITSLAKKHEILKNVSDDQIFDALQKREEVASTGFENGIAIPHCFIDGISDFVAGILIAPEGVHFNSIDGEKTTIFTFIIGPEGERNRHIKYLSNISHTLRVPEVRHELISATHTESVMESFLRHSSVETIGDADDPTCLAKIFIQDEDKFESILEIVQSTDIKGIAVVEAENADTYLNKMPLFASIMSDKSRGYMRIIIAIINKSLINEVIRQVDIETGGFEDNPGVSLVVQENTLVYGSLNL